MVYRNNFLDNLSSRKICHCDRPNSNQYKYTIRQCKNYLNWYLPSQVASECPIVPSIPPKFTRKTLNTTENVSQNKSAWDYPQAIRFFHRLYTML